MKTGQPFALKAGPRWPVILGTVLLVLLIFLIEPQLYYLNAIPIFKTPLYFFVGLVGYYISGRKLDGIIFILIHLCAEIYGEPIFGPYALATLTLGILAISGRPRFSAFIGGAVFTLLLGSIELKRRFAGSVLTWQDIRYFFLRFDDNLGVLVSQPTILIYAGFACLALFIVGGFFWINDSHKIIKNQSVRKSHYTARIFSMLIVVWCVCELNSESKKKSQINPIKLQLSSAIVPVSTFLSTIYLQPVADYEKVNTHQFNLEVNEAVKLNLNRSLVLADIVIFLQESQFNPMAVKDCVATICESDLFGVTKETTDYGELRVHTFGGGTWLSEFSIETGVPHTLFGRAGDYASFNVAPSVRRSFVRSLRDAGYHTVAVYPVKGGMMNARIAYSSYGFDQFLDSSDLGLPGTYETPDSVIHAAALKALNDARRHGKPVFLLALTIFNHSEHGVDIERIPLSLRNEVKQKMGASSDSLNLADYVWRTKEFESTFRRTRAAVLSSDRPTVLAWFGDHQPPFGNAIRLRESIKPTAISHAVPSRYVTWYNISSNIELEKSEATPDLLDIVFLPGLIAQRAGVPLDNWLIANILTRGRCGGLIVECIDPNSRDVYYSYLLNDLHTIN